MNNYIQTQINHYHKLPKNKQVAVQVIIIASILSVVYIVYKQRKSSYDNKEFLDAVGAGEAFHAGIEITDDMTDEEKEKARKQILDRTKAYEELRRLLAIYSLETGKTGKGMTIKQLQVAINEHRRHKVLWKQYTVLTGKVNADPYDERWNTNEELAGIVNGLLETKRLKAIYDKAVEELVEYSGYEPNFVRRKFLVYTQVNDEMMRLRGIETEWNKRLAYLLNLAMDYYETAKVKSGFWSTPAWNKYTLNAVQALSESEFVAMDKILHDFNDTVLPYINQWRRLPAERKKALGTPAAYIRQSMTEKDIEKLKIKIRKNYSYSAIKELEMDSSNNRTGQSIATDIRRRADKLIASGLIGQSINKFGNFDNTKYV